MNRKYFWSMITGIAVLLIVVPVALGIHSSVNKKDVPHSADTTVTEQNNKNKKESPKLADPPEETKSSSVPKEYVVQKGDSLWGIAQKFQTSIDALKELNNLTEDLLILGQELLIPASGADQTVEGTDKGSEALSSRGMDEQGRYVVQEGDSLWAIAVSCGTSVASIKELNNLTDERITPEMVLQIKGEARPSNQQDNVVSAETPVPVTSNQKSEPVLQVQPRSSVVDTASRYVGSPYVPGGSSPSGFDCSGFVAYVYQQHGISLPRSASAQSGMGTKVSSPAPGDLLFFAENGQVFHVAIYAGNGSFIHARNGKYGVCYTSQGDSCYQWYKDRYCGANRI